MPTRGRPPYPDILTPREWEVLALLRDGLTNDEIAARLNVAPSTARFHVSEILGKLGVSSRDEAARWQPEPRPRRAWLATPAALLRRTAALGTGARLATAGILVVVAAGIALLAWGVMTESGHGGGGSPALLAPATPPACATPAVPTPGLELGSAPIFWRFGLTEEDLTSGHLCVHNLKIVLRVTNGAACGSGEAQSPDVVQAGNVATGEHLSFPASCTTCPGAACPGVDLPGAYFVAGPDLPSAGEWRLQVRFGADLSSQTVRIGGADVPTADLGPQPPCAPPQQSGGEPAMAVVLVERATGQCKVIPTADRLMQAKWVEDGKTFVAYDVDGRAFVIYDVDGTPLEAIDLKIDNPPPPSSPIYGTISPAPDGKTLLVERTVPGLNAPLVIRDVASGQDEEFPQPDGLGRQASFSPDGRHAAYINTNAGQQSLVIADAASADGHFSIVRSVDAEHGLHHAARLVARRQVPACCMTGKRGPAGQGASTQVVRGGVGAMAARTVWSSGDTYDPTRLVFAEWAGAGRLLIREPSVRASDGTPLAAQAQFVSVPDGQRTDADPAYAALDSVSPDGAAGISDGSLIELPSLSTTRMAESGRDVSSDWTADSSEALLSFPGV